MRRFWIDDVGLINRKAILHPTSYIQNPLPPLPVNQRHHFRSTGDIRPEDAFHR
jgi:hypothetical protein